MAALVAALGTTVAAIPCGAATVDASNGAGVTLEEVLVTATRREESVQKIPISITALGESELVAVGVKSIEDLNALVPGLQFAVPNGFSSAFTTIAIRGLNSNTGPSTVGLYLDDSPISSRLSGYTNQGSAYPYVFDLNRIEVARGPQGTLFGAGAEAGTVRFIPNAPNLSTASETAHGEVSMTEGGQLSYEGGVAAGGPIVQDKIGFRISIWDRGDGGWVNRVDPWNGDVVSPDANGNHKFAARAALAFKLSDDVLLTPSLYYQRVTQDDAQRFFAAFSNAPQGVYNNAVLLPEAWTDRWVLPSIKLEAHLPYADLTTTASYFDRDVPEILDQSPFVCPGLHNGPGGTPGCGNPLGIGFANSPADVSFTPTGLNVKATTVEVRLASNTPDARISWVAGVFYDHRVQKDFQTSYTNYGTQILSVPTPIGALFQDQHETFTDDQYAAYAQADFHLTDKLVATLGERIGNVKVTVEERSDPRVIALYSATASPDVITSSKETPSTPKAGLSYQLDRDNLLYASYSKGFRIGGANAIVPPSCPQVVPSTYSSDYVQNYEVGAKDTFLGGKVQVNTSAFHAVWKNIQQYTSLPCGPFAYSTNAGSAISNGLDLSLRAIVTDSMRLDLNASYIDAYYDSNGYDKLGNLLVASGYKVGILPQVNAPWTVNAAIDYVVPLSTGDRINARADVNFTSRNPGPFLSQLVNSPNTYPLERPDPSTTLVNLRVGYARKGIDVTLFINNVLNSTPWLSTYQGVASSNLVTNTTFRPRTIGVAANFDF
jgi:outer membrane receptor protein involved in Fe transport